MTDGSTSPFTQRLLGDLAELLTTLNRLLRCANQRTAADPDEAHDVVQTLTLGVCERWFKICAAPSAPFTSPIEYCGRRFSGHAEIIYLETYATYQDLYEVVRGYPDDALQGWLDEEDVRKRWPAIALRQLTRTGALPAAELIRLAEIAGRELLTVPEKLWPLPFVFQPPGAPTDRWSPEAATGHAALLSAYREDAPLDGGRDLRVGNADLMKVAAGEPADRFVTKLGGLPYRPVSVPWPCHSSGEPMVFLGQICFADSHDLVGPLPGDVLLIFTHDPHDHTSGGAEDLRYEWFPLGIEGLMVAADVPETAWKVFPCHMHLLRDDDTGDDVYQELGKIGGPPRWIQGAIREPGQLLAEFASVEFLGEPDGTDPPVRHLDFFDSGLLQFFLRPDGRVAHCFQCD